VVAIDADARASEEREGVSRMIAGPDLPFHPSTFRALASTGDAASIESMVGLVTRGGRIVLEHPEPDADERLGRAGARVVGSQADWTVAVRETS
jgi:hypothetical protein